EALLGVGTAVRQPLACIAASVLEHLVGDGRGVRGRRGHGRCLARRQRESGQRGPGRARTGEAGEGGLAHHVRSARGTEAGRCWSTGAPAEWDARTACARKRGLGAEGGAGAPYAAPHAAERTASAPAPAAPCGSRRPRERWFR